MPTPEPAPRVSPLPRRILVAGTSGSGKSTLAVQIAEVGGQPYVEIDALFHGPGWTPRPEFERDVDGSNTEPPLRTIATDPDHIIRWAWRTHGRLPEMVGAAAAANPALEIIRLGSPRATERWLRDYADAVGVSIAPPKRRFRPA